MGLGKAKTNLINYYQPLLNFSNENLYEDRAFLYDTMTDTFTQTSSLVSKYRAARLRRYTNLNLAPVAYSLDLVNSECTAVKGTLLTVCKQIFSKIE